MLRIMTGALLQPVCIDSTLIENACCFSAQLLGYVKGIEKKGAERGGKGGFECIMRNREEQNIWSSPFIP